MKQRFFKIAMVCLTSAFLHPGAANAQVQTPDPNGSAVNQADAPKPEEFKPSGKIWGYAFGDYGYKVHGDSTGNAGKRSSAGNQYANQPKDFGAFAFRRIYLGYDYSIAKNFTTQLLLAHESDGTLTSDGNRAFFIKLANVRWTFAKNTDLVIGSQETPGFPMLEERIWGYRSVEKTISDFRKNITSTDLGASIQGRLNDKGDYGYNLLLSNGTVAKPENDVYKKISGDIYGKFMDQHIVLDLYGDYQLSTRSPIEKNIATGKVFAAYTTDMITVGVTVFEQVLSHGVTYTETGSTNKNVKNDVIFGASAFVRGRIIKDKLNYYLRYDNYNPDNTYNNARIYTGGAAPVVANQKCAFYAKHLV
jgi:hypothetical protein